MRNNFLLHNFFYTGKVMSYALLSMVFVFFGQVNAHEIQPAIVSISAEGDQLNVEVELSLEAVLAGVDLAEIANTQESENEDDYNRLRALSVAELESYARDNWRGIQDKIYLSFNDNKTKVNLNSIDITAQTNVELARLSVLKMAADIPFDARTFQFGWSSELGLMVLRRTDLENGFAGYVEPGDLSPPLEISAQDDVSNLGMFAQFIPVGFDHIIPKGVDHILFVVGLFLFSTQLRPLLWQVSAFTLAHTITLALASLKIIEIPASIVEPLIAISIAYVAIENIFVTKISFRRPLVIFGFGLLHGLGFASVLADFGLPGAGFVAALIGFNVGVEVGQLAIIAICFFGFGLWFRNKDWYRSVIVVPVSLLIAAIGIWWAFERIFLT